MISPEQYKEYFYSSKPCKFESKVTEIRFTKDDFNFSECFEWDLLIKTEAWIYVKWDVYTWQCDWWIASFWLNRTPEVWKKYFFVVSQKNENGVISHSSENYKDQVDLDYSKVPDCENKNVLKEKFENWYKWEKFFKQAKYFQEWKKGKDWYWFWDYGFFYSYELNSHNQVFYEVLSFFNPDIEISLIDLRNEAKIYIPDYKYFQDENNREKISKIAKDIYKYRKTWEISDSIKLTKFSKKSDVKYFDDNLIQSFLSRKNVDFEKFYDFLEWKTNLQKEKIMEHIMNLEIKHQEKFAKIYSEFRIVPKNEKTKTEIKENNLFFALLFVLVIFFIKIFSKNAFRKTK